MAKVLESPRQRNEAHQRRESRQRIEERKRRRDAAGRQAHVRLHPKNRGFDPISVLLASDADRLSELLPIKYGRMQASPFSFFRGAVSIMAADFARLPNSGLDVQLCGDAHLQNLGSFESPDGSLVFDINDFDETIRGPFELDLKRMAASIVLSGRDAHRDRAACQAAAEAFIEKYCESIRIFSELPILEVARHQVNRGDHVALIHAALLQLQRATPLALLKKLTEPGSHAKPRFRDEPPLLRRLSRPEGQAVLRSLRAYRETLPAERHHFFDLFHPIAVGFKVAGTGSIGRRNYIVLFEGNGPRDPMFLQIKEEGASTWAKYLKTGDSAKSQGQRAAEGQRALQPMSDILLGWTKIGKRDFVVRQLNDRKGSIDLKKLRGSGLKQLAIVAGELLARAHARSGDACQIRGFCGSPKKMAKVLGRFAVEYADQTGADFRAFEAAIKKGRVKAEKLKK